MIEHWFWFRRRIPQAVGAEAMVGRPVTVVFACRPEGRACYGRESWNATTFPNERETATEPRYP